MMKKIKDIFSKENIYISIRIFTIYFFISYCLCTLWYQVIENNMFLDSLIKAFYLWFFISVKISEAMLIIVFFMNMGSVFLTIPKYFLIIKPLKKVEKQTIQKVHEEYEEYAKKLKNKERERHENGKTFSINN